MIDRLVLWDIDGTLVHAGDVSAEIIEQAVQQVVGAPVVSHVALAGKTDPQIVREYLAQADRCDEEAIGEVLVALERLFSAAGARVRREGSASKGAREALSALARRRGVVQSVLTGNIAANALVKLSAFGLDAVLDLEAGAYGSDAEDRSALLPVALARLADRRGVTLDAASVWIVGDTPADLNCARANGARCLLVASGTYARADLEALGPDALLDDLCDTDTVVSILTTGGRGAGRVTA